MVVVCSTMGIETTESTIHCVYLTTLRGKGYEDIACILKPGDHPFIDHESYIEYSKLLHIRKSYLNQCLARGEAKKQASVPKLVLQRIMQGASHSTAIRDADKKFFL